MKKKKGFTLVELLAVIVILAVILVIAVPQIMSVIESARKGSIESTAKLIAEGAEREYTNRKILGKDTNIECSDVSSMNSNDYGTCVISFDNRGKATVSITGKGKFEGYTCNGNSTNMECTKKDTTPTNASYFSYSEVEGGVAITGYLVRDANVVVKDKDKCVTYLPTIGATEEQANTLCSGNALDNGMTLKDAVQRGVIPSSDYATAGLEVTYNGGGTDVVIPSEIDGKKVVAIADYAFTSRGVAPTNISNTKKVSASYLYNKDRITTTPLASGPTISISGLGITSVVIPSTVKSIGGSAFAYNQLTEVTIPSTVTSIGGSAFYGNKLTEVIIPGSISVIEKNTFNGNELTSIVIPSSVTSIENMAFYGNQLTSITLSNSVTSIGDHAFSSNQLTSIIIPNSVKTIGTNAFSSNKLTSLTLLDGVTSIGDDAFDRNQLTEVTIPSSIKTIGANAFANNKLTKIAFPSTSLTIGCGAFGGNPITNGGTYTYPSNVTVGECK